ncbi:MAG: P-loop NTPase [Clostridia bacterium]|nr:P-loop NTPase [Clostridia bacterium]
MSKTYLILSGKGGVGKSTTAVSLAAAFSERGLSCAIMDGDVGLRCADLMLNMQDKIVYDFMDLCEGDCSLEDALYDVPWMGPGRVSLLATSQMLRASQVRPKDVKKITEEMKKHFGAVIIDGPAGIGRNLKVLIDASDECIMVATPDDISLRDAEKAGELLREHEKDHAWLVLNRLDPYLVRSGVISAPKDISTALDMPLLGVIPDSPEIYPAMLRRCCAYYSGDRKVKKAYDQTVSRLLGADIQFRDIKMSPVIRFFSRWRGERE